jgi:hypothetical protein
MPATAAPTGGSTPSRRQHAIYHPLLRRRHRLGFFDLMLADPKSGRVIAKELDFVTSLHIGPYRTSNVSAAVASCGAARDRSAVCFEDFAPYAPVAHQLPSWQRR